MSNRYLAMDDDPCALRNLIGCLKQADADGETHAFARIADALRAIQDGFQPTAAFLDIHMQSHMTGLELARVLRQLSPATDIVFVTEHDEYALEACSLRASGYLLKVS